MHHVPTFGKLKSSSPQRNFGAAPSAAVSTAAAHNAAPRATYASLLMDASPDQEVAAPYEHRVGVAETDMLRAIGSNWEKFRPVWERMNGDPSSPKMSFGFAPFFLTSFWLLYRKQYGWFFVATAVNLGASFAVPSVSTGMALASAVVCGLVGRSLVAGSAMRMVRNIRSQGFSEAEGSRRIEKAGGTNLWAPILLAVVMLVGAMIAAAASVKSAASHESSYLRTTQQKR